MIDVHCCDCGGFDLEWMRRCSKHGTEYCRGCSCTVCEDELDDEDDDLFDWYEGQPPTAGEKS